MTKSKKIKTRKRNTIRKNKKIKNKIRKKHKTYKKHKKISGTKREVKAGMRGFSCIDRCCPITTREERGFIEREFCPELDDVSLLLAKEHVHYDPVLELYKVEGRDRSGQKLYSLDPSTFGLISCHGDMDDHYTIVPKGITLHFPVRVGMSNYSGGWPEYNPKEYYSTYREGSLIQDQLFTFSPHDHKGKEIHTKMPRMTNKEQSELEPALWSTDNHERLSKIKRDYEDHITYVPVGILRSDILYPDKRSIPESKLGFRGAPDKRYIDYLMTTIYRYKPLSDMGSLTKGEQTDIFFEGNYDEIIDKRDLASGDFSLRKVLTEISREREQNTNIPEHWFCLFCRGTKYADALDIETLKRCQTSLMSGLPKLRSDFFDTDVTFEGVPADLTELDDSLSSKLETANFLETIQEIYSYHSKLEHTAEWKSINKLLQPIITKSRRGCPKLTSDEVCFVFQVKQLYKDHERSDLM